MALTDAVTALWPHGGPGEQYGSFAGKAPLPEIPDVVGETQAAGTTELETALFVVAVETEYSALIAAGLIISQDPVGGSFANPGSTVTIVVSLGPEPVAESAGGGADKSDLFTFRADYSGAQDDDDAVLGIIKEFLRLH